MLMPTSKTYAGLMVLLLMIILSGCNCGSPIPKDWTTYQVKSPYEGEKPDPYKQLMAAG